MFLFNMEPKG